MSFLSTFSLKFRYLTRLFFLSRKIDTKNEQFLTHAHKKVIVYFVTCVMGVERNEMIQWMNECELYVWYMKWSEIPTGVRMCVVWLNFLCIFLISFHLNLSVIFFTRQIKVTSCENTTRTNVCHRMIKNNWNNERLMALKRCRFWDKALEVLIKTRRTHESTKNINFQALSYHHPKKNDVFFSVFVYKIPNT